MSPRMVSVAELNAAFISASDAVRAAAFAAGLAHRDKLPHYPRMLDAEERAHYAWLRGDYTLQDAIDETRPDIEEGLVDELQNHGIYTQKDFLKIISDSEEAKGFLEDAEAARDGAKEAILALAEHLAERGKPLGVRASKALAQVLQKLADDGEFSYADRKPLIEALDHD